MSESTDLARLYAERFAAEDAARTAMWDTLCEGYFQRWVDPGATVLEVAAGHCEFINGITAARKLAIDLNPDVQRYAAADVETHVCTSTDMSIDARTSRFPAMRRPRPVRPLVRRKNRTVAAIATSQRAQNVR